MYKNKKLRRRKYMKKIFAFMVGSLLMLSVPFTASAAPLPEEPSWEYIKNKYPNGITVAEAKAEGIIQNLSSYFSNSVSVSE